MTQPCKNFKVCRGYAHDRKSKLCPKCWKKNLELMRLKNPLKSISHDEKNIHFEFTVAEKGEGQ